MDTHSYLQQSNEETILNHWYSCGQITVNNLTKYYTKDSIIRVDCSKGDEISSAPLHNKILYVIQTFQVDGKAKLPIDWSIMNIDDVKGLYTALEGVMVPYFVILPAKWSATFIPDKDFIPYTESIVDDLTGCINISDDELSLILTSIGFPFLNFNDLEIAKNEIIKYCIKPAMQRYFTFKPIVKEEAGGQLAQGSEFCVPFPTDAYAAIPYYTVPGGSSGFGGKSGSPFAFYNEQVMMGGMTMGGMGGGRFGRGVRYHGKQVPGYVGLDNKNALINQMAANQGFLNFFRREKYSRVKIDGKYFAKGYSSIGGNLNIKWLCTSNDYDDVKFEDLEILMRPMARVEVLNNFAMLRSLVKTDIAGQLDATVLLNKAEKIEENIQAIIKSIGLTGANALMRGGG